MAKITLVLTDSVNELGQPCVDVQVMNDTGGKSFNDGNLTMAQEIAVDFVSVLQENCESTVPMGNVAAIVRH